MKRKTLFFHVSWKFLWFIVRWVTLTKICLQLINSYAVGSDSWNPFYKLNFKYQNYLKFLSPSAWELRISLLLNIFILFWPYMSCCRLGNDWGYQKICYFTRCCHERSVRRYEATRFYKIYYISLYTSNLKFRNLNHIR